MGFFEIYVVTDKGGLSQCGHSVDNGGRGSIFRDYVRTSKWTAPYLVH